MTRRAMGRLVGLAGLAIVATATLGTSAAWADSVATSGTVTSPVVLTGSVTSPAEGAGPQAKLTITPPGGSAEAVFCSNTPFAPGTEQYGLPQINTDGTWACDVATAPAGTTPAYPGTSTWFDPNASANQGVPLGVTVWLNAPDNSPGSSTITIAPSAAGPLADPAVVVAGAAVVAAGGTIALRRRRRAQIA